MERRTHEGHMDWEYQNQGPFDPTSPFTHAARSGTLHNGFSSPVKSNAFSNPNLPATPIRFQAASRNPMFPSQQAQIAPPFMNPAFTTPRKSYDDPPSGIEDSPAPTETSELPDDSPDADRFSDITMGGTINPAKIDKTVRYKSRQSARRHMPGKGEIMPARSRQPLYRWRKHHERGIGNNLHMEEHEMSEDDSDSPLYSTHGRSASRGITRQARAPTGFFGSLLHTVDQYPNLPDVLHKWIWFVVCSFTGGTACFVVWGVLNTVRTDIMTANEAARAVTTGQMAACQKQWIANDCSTAQAPKLIELCDEWFGCMTQSTDVVYSRVFLVELSKLANDVFSEWSMRTALAVVLILLIWILARWATGHTPSARIVPTNQTTAPDAMPVLSRVPVETPRRRQFFINVDEDTDTDLSPPVFAQRQLLPGRTSPSKRERSRSPVKYSRRCDVVP